ADPINAVAMATAMPVINFFMYNTSDMNFCEHKPCFRLKLFIKVLYKKKVIVQGAFWRQVFYLRWCCARIFLGGLSFL
ncbi:MAG: hypothetical protein J6S81_07535, partial [Treponema sp.]|nr:hypothetical protein [Treponema sp.]